MTKAECEWVSQLACDMGDPLILWIERKLPNGETDYGIRFSNPFVCAEIREVLVCSG